MRRDRGRLLDRDSRGGAAQSAKTGKARPAPVIVTGAPSKLTEPFDRMMEQFVLEHRIPGAAWRSDAAGDWSTRGFTLADKEAESKVEPRSLFRIASVAKPITAVAVLKLVDRGKLSLEDKAFEVLNTRKDGKPIAT